MKYEVLGVGALILDLILPVDESFLKEVPGKKGGMELISHHTMQQIIKSSGKVPTMAAGGSGMNTIKGLANFGHSCAMTGKLGNDENGKRIAANIKELKITPLYMQSQTPTGLSLCLVTPDTERTLRTYVGAAKEMSGADLNPAWFEGVKLVHLEGYTLLNHELAERAITLAKEAGAKVSFDLASFEIATKYKEKIIHLLSRHIDILFANESETRTFTKLDPERGCDILKDLCETVVVYLGEHGGWAARGTEKIRYPAFKTNPLDTTGAGDLFASGFLHGYLLDLPLEECTRRGALAASTVVQVMGAEIPPDHWKQLHDKIHQKKT